MKANAGGNNNLFPQETLHAESQQNNYNDLIQRVIEAEPSIVRKVSSGTEETMSDRVRKLVSETTLSNSQFERTCGLSNGFLNNMGERISARSIGHIVATMPYVSIAWIMSGSGDMIVLESLEAYYNELRDAVGTQSAPEARFFFQATQALYEKYFLKAGIQAAENQILDDDDLLLLPVYDLSQIDTAEHRRMRETGELRPQGFLNGRQYPKCDYAVRKGNKTYGVVDLITETPNTAAETRTKFGIYNLLKAGSRYFLSIPIRGANFEYCDIYKFKEAEKREIPVSDAEFGDPRDPKFYDALTFSDSEDPDELPSLTCDGNSITHLALVRFCITLETY